MLTDDIAKVLRQHRFTSGRGQWSCPCGVEGKGRLARAMAERHLAEEIRAEIETQGVTTDA